MKVVIRPERVVLEPHGTEGENRIPGMVERLVYTGPSMQLIVRLAAGVSLQVMIPNRRDTNPFPQGAPVTVTLPADSLRVLSAAEERAVADSEDEAPAGAPSTT